MFRRSCIGVAGLAALAACGANPEIERADQGGGPSPSTAGGGPGGVGSDFGFDPNVVVPSGPDAGLTLTMNCGFRKLGLQRLPAELLLVLDKSASMNSGLGNATTRWRAVTSVLTKVVSQTKDAVFWGLKLFPSGTGSCLITDGVEVEPGTMAHEVVSDKVEATLPSGGTPTREAVRQATEYLKNRPTPHPKYILLATDGLPNCRPSSNGVFGGEDSAGALEAVSDAVFAGFQTFVVGVATTNSEAHETLNQMAMRGGRARQGPTSYHAADSSDELAQALETIAGEVASCSFTLDESPPSPNDVAVDVDGQRVPRETVNGWEYGPNMRSVTLHGTWCEQVKRGVVKEVQIIFGCPGVVIP